MGTTSAGRVQIPWSLSRVTGKDHDPGKHWYVLTSSLCGIKPNKLAQNEIFCRFPEKISSVPPADLKPTKRGFSFNMQPTKLFVVSLFGLLSALLRQHDLGAVGFVGSPEFISLRDEINRIALDECDELCSLGGKSVSSDGSHEFQKLQLKAAKLESEIKKLERKTNVGILLFLFPLLWLHCLHLIAAQTRIVAAAATTAAAAVS